MLTYTDVTDDPAARDRSTISDAWFEEAARLDFHFLAWTFTTLDEKLLEKLSPRRNVDDVSFLTAVLVSGDRAFLSLSRTKQLDELSIMTIFEDGTVLSTSRKPHARFRLRRWRLEHTPARHRYHLTFHDVASIATLVSIHEARVAAEEKRGLRVVTIGDLPTYLSMRKRWREIDDPRREHETKIANGISLSTTLLGVVAAIATGVRLAPSMGGYALIIAIVGALLALPLGIGAFLIAHRFFAPLIARVAEMTSMLVAWRAPAPPPRPAHELRRLADQVKRGRLPDRSARAGAASEREAPDTPATITVDLSPADLARAQKIDLVLTTANDLVLPIAMLIALAVLGTAGGWAAMGIVLTVDGAIGIVLKTTRTQLVREKLVPELARACRVCTSKSACVVGKVTPYFWIAYGIAGLFVARRHFGLPREPVSYWLLLECCGMLMIFAYLTLSATKRRHERFGPA